MFPPSNGSQLSKIYPARTQDSPMQDARAKRDPVGRSSAPSVGVRPPEARRQPVRELWLSLLVHLDSLRLDPRRYLEGMFWRMRRLKVRSRHRLAMLAGRSSHAYGLWILRNEPRLLREVMEVSAGSKTVIHPVIDCRSNSDGLEVTLASVTAAGGAARPVVIGGTLNVDAIRISHPYEIARFAQGSTIWLCPLNPGDRLSTAALSIYSSAAARSGEAHIIYGDDDLIDPEGRRQAPHFKPDWNPELFKHHDYLTGAAVIRTSPKALFQVPAAGWIESLVCSALETGAAPVHLPLVLHHRRQRPNPSVPGKPEPMDSDSSPLVTVIVPTRNGVELLRKCIEGLRGTYYSNFEIIIIDNGSDDPTTLECLSICEAEGMTVLRIPGAFNFSALNNAAVRNARGSLLCFLNNDVEIIDPDWLKLLVRQATRSEIGAVGASLLYPDRTIQHAGVCIGLGGGAGHAHRFQKEDEAGYFQRARLPQQVSAVTAACLVVARDKFLSVGGFDELSFPVAFNDVDLCLKLNQRGWQSFYEPRAILIHHESKSRGCDRAENNRVRFACELAALKRKWHTEFRHDPYHHPRLSRFSEQFVISL